MQSSNSQSESMSSLEQERDLSGPSKVRRESCLRELLEKKTIDTNIVGILLSIENVPLNITEYRDKEKYLENLLNEFRNEKLSKDLKTQTFTLRYLLGSLYINFEKFWGPTIRITIELINLSPYQSKLLDILICHLKETNGIIYDESKTIDKQCPEDRADHILHRNFIFQLMSKFSNYIETHSEKFINEFFLFAEKELYVSPFVERCTRVDLTKKVTDLEETQKENNCESSIHTGPKRNDPLKSVFKNKKQIDPSILEKRKSRETFITASKVIQSFKNIKKVHRQDELKCLMLDLLCCRDSSVQRAAFNCFLIYDRTSIEPYIERLLKILNDKKVRNELSIFSVDADESCQVLPEHRSNLIPVLQRILFGRMIGQVGKKSSGQDKADLRKTLVMRFIAGCEIPEILSFFELLFEPVIKFLNTPYESLERDIKKSFDLHNFIPINKLQAMLSSLSSYMEIVANLRPDSLPHVLKLLNIIIYHTIAPLDNQDWVDQMSFKTIDSFKTVRRNCLATMTDFFKSFDYYNHKQDEIDFIFKILIWPSCQSFVDRNHATITPILKLIEAFAESPTYNLLLVKRNKSCRDEYLMKHLIDLYQDSKTKSVVLKFIASILSRLLNENKSCLDDDDVSGVMPVDIQIFEDRDAVKPPMRENEFKVRQDIPLGHEILLSFTPIIFERLRKNCQEWLSKEDVQNRITDDELIILSTLSEYLRDSPQSLLASKLLLSTLSNQRKGSLIINTLKTAQALMRQVEKNTDPQIVSIVAETLSYQRNVEQRNELCNLIDVLAQVDNNLLKMTKIIRLMNLYHEDLVDMPDLAKWNEGFQLAFNYLDNLNETHINQPIIVRDSLVLILHQLGFIINNVDKYEFSIRENCSLFFERLAEKLNLIDVNSNQGLLQQLLDNILLEKFIRRGFRETNTAIKHLYIGILRTLAMECYTKNKTLSELHLFCDRSEEKDFWLGIKNIQLHNRSKALANLVSEKGGKHQELKKVSPKTLSCYFMPIASGFLFSKAYKSVSSLAENSIKLIGIICKQLNWITYESTLSYYLGLLTKANTTYQRTNIKLITEILKNFNFDITNCEEAMQHEGENTKLEKRMKKRRGVDEEGCELPVIATDAPSGKKLNPSTARMVYNSVTKKLIPRLNSCLHEMTRVEFEADKNMSNYLPEKDEIKRIPISFAIVQLLNLLPGRYVLLRDQLPALLLKITSFLKSKNEQVRKAARMTLIRVMNFVGPAYLSDMLRVLKQNLDKGFHIHVLNYSIHAVLNKLPLRYGDVDGTVNELVDLSIQEIVGKISEDKEISKVLAKTSEAKKTKSYDTLLILSSYVSVDKLNQIISPIKELLKTTNDSKKVNKISVCVQRVFAGLALNEKYPLDKLLYFIRNTIEESIPSLKISQKVDQVENHREESGTSRREDRFLISKDPSRDRIKSRINEKGNFHMLVENSLKLLLATFEKNKAKIKREEKLRSQLDGFISLLCSCLKSSSPRCVTRSLKCICLIARIKADLPSFKTKSNSIVKKIFILLNLYNGVGMVQGDNYEMIEMCFKTLNLLMLRYEHVDLDSSQIRALMSYIEQDLHDSMRQSTAFGTLHSILRRKFVSPELPDIMTKVADLMVTSSEPSTRSYSIKIWQIYLLEYEHERNMIQNHLTKFLRQIDYEYIDGRKSVLKMMNIIVEKFPEKLLRDYFELIFHLLGQRVVNEESKEVRLIVAKLIGLLIQRLPDKQEYLLNRFVFSWASNQSLELRLLGIKLLSIFLESTVKIFEGNKERTFKILEIIEKSLEMKLPKKNGDVPSTNGCEEAEVDSEIETEPKQESVRLVKVDDKLVYHSLQLYKRLLNKSLLASLEVRYIKILKKIWHNIASNQLTHWWDQVVQVACELYYIFIEKNDISGALNVQDPSTDNYLEWNATRIVRLLCDKYIDLLDRFESGPILGYITQSLILLGQAVSQSRATIEFEESYRDSFDKQDIIGHLLNLKELPNDGFSHQHMPYEFNEAKRRVNLMWLSVKIVMQAKKEAALYRLSKNYRRDFVLCWTAIMVANLDAHRLAPYLILFLMTPVRELTDKNKTKSSVMTPSQQTITLSEDLLKGIKSILGVELFNKIYSRVQLHYTRKRIDRKKKEALIKVKDQVRGVKRKLKERKGKEAKRKKVRKENFDIRKGRSYGKKKIKSF